MTFTEQIQEFIPKAITRVRALQTTLNENFDYRGYQSDDSVLLLQQIGETYNLIELLGAYNYGGLTEREVRDLMDFFTDWLDLNVVIPDSYSGYSLPIQPNVIVASGTYALQVDLSAEIAARIAADQVLSARITTLENATPPEGMPDGWDDLYDNDIKVVFNDDPRLHTHDNKDDIDQIDAADIENIKALGTHFASLGGEDGQHVTPEDRARWDAAAGVDTEEPVYAGGTPVTNVVGNINVGFDPSGLTSLELWEYAMVSFLTPLFTLFNSTMSTLIEVGTALSGSKVFNWVLSHPENVDTVAIRDVTTNTVIATGLANDGTETVAIGTITNTSPMTHSWRGEGLNTEANPITPSANFTVQSIYPYFYGKVASAGAAPGVNRPVANQALINSGSKVVADSTGTVVINFNTSSDDYAWFAIPLSSAAKLSWYTSALNTGPIGGSVSPGGNLFPDFDTVSIDSPTVLWAGVQYKIYVANYQSAIAVAMQLRNT